MHETPSDRTPSLAQAALEQIRLHETDRGLSPVERASAELAVAGGGWMPCTWIWSPGLTDCDGRLAQTSPDAASLALLALDRDRLTWLRANLMGDFSSVARMHGVFGIGVQMCYVRPQVQDPEAAARQAVRAAVERCVDRGQAGAVGSVQVTPQCAWARVFVPADALPAPEPEPERHPALPEGFDDETDPEVDAALEQAFYDEIAALHAIGLALATPTSRLPFTPQLHWVGHDAQGDAAWCTSPLLASGPLAEAVAAEREQLEKSGASVR